MPLAPVTTAENTNVVKFTSHPNVAAAYDAGRDHAGLTEQDVLQALPLYQRRPRRGFAALRYREDLWANPEIARSLVNCALVLGRLDVADNALPFERDDSGLLRAQLSMARDDPAAALAALSDVPAQPLEKARFHGLRIRALVELRAYADAIGAAHRWSWTAQGSPMPYRTLARCLSDTDDPRAGDWFECAVFMSGGCTVSRLDLAEYLIDQGRTTKARKHLRALPKLKGRAAKRRKRLLQRI